MHAANLVKSSLCSSYQLRIASGPSSKIVWNQILFLTGLLLAFSDILGSDLSKLSSASRKVLFVLLEEELSICTFTKKTKERVLNCPIKYTLTLNLDRLGLDPD